MLVSAAISILVLGHSLSVHWPQHLPDRYAVTNRAVAGYGTAQGWDVRFFDGLAKPELPVDWCTMIFGTGPAQTGIGIGQHETHLRSVIGKVLSYGCGRVLLIPTPPVRPPFLGDVEPYRELHRDLCRSITGVVCGPPLDQIVPLEMVSADGVHLTPEGEKLVAFWVEIWIRVTIDHPWTTPHFP